MASISNKAGWSIAIAVSLAFAATLAGWVHAGGPLDPPGAPGVTMKSLDEVEPRTPISALPFTISQPGSYYLTGNLSVNTAIDGITVQADDVTIDLNGFALNGNGVGSSAITQGASSPSRHNWRIYNGAIVGWGYAVFAFAVSNAQLDHFTASGIVFDGVMFGANARLTDCAIESTGDGGNLGTPIGVGIGIGAGSIVDSCASRYFEIGISVAENSTVRNCNVSAVFGVKERASTITGCRVAATNAGITAESDRSTILGNQIDMASAIGSCGIRDVSWYGATIDGNQIIHSATGACLTPNMQATATRNSFVDIATSVFSGYTGNDVPSVVAASSATNPLANTCVSPPGVCSSTP